MAKKYKTEMSRLCGAMQTSRKVLQYARRQHTEAARLYAGDQWNDETAIERTFVNFIALYVDIVLRNLISKNPRCMLSTFEKANKPVAATMMEWANVEFDRMNLANTMKRCALDGLFSMGILKVSLADPSDAAMASWNQTAGDPCIQRVDLDDFVFDTEARDMEEVRFIGHRRRVPLATVKESKMYGQARKDLSPTVQTRFNQEGDERIYVLGRGYWGNDQEIEDMIELWEVYIPSRRCVYTLVEDCLTGAMAVENGGEPEALLEQDWVGHETGPYKILGFGTVPGNARPKGPVMNLINLHRSLNRIIRKLIWSGENLKEVLLAPKGMDGDIDRIRSSIHGDILPIDNAKGVASVTMNMPNNMLVQLFEQLKNLFSWMAGNLDIMGGLSSQAKTLGQDKISQQNATQGIADMQDRMITFTSDVIRSFLWYPWHNPKLVMKSNYSPQGLPDVQITRELHPWNSPDPGAMKRSMNWEDLHIKIDPYSMAHSSPQQRAADLIGVVKEVWTPLAQLASQQGVVLDFNMLMEKIGQYKDMPDLQEIMTMQQPPPEQPQGGGQQAGTQPAPEETTHIRENVPMRSEKGNSLNLINAMSGVNGGGASKNGQPQGSY